MNDRAKLSGASPMVFAGSPLDRCEVLRRDANAIRELTAEPGAREIILCQGDPEIDDNGLVWHPIDNPRDAFTLRVFLGKLHDSPVFARSGDATALHQPARAAAMGMPHRDAAIYAQAKSLLDWHNRHSFCANCGTETHVGAGGAKRVCPSCHAEHFPRVDPVVIMLAEHEDQVLLGRQESWPEGVWSALAGFVEPAETLEEACARELSEEAGVTTDIAGIRYVFCQPWPFPSSLMVGLLAPATSPALKVDTHELEAARWFSRKEVAAMLSGTHADAVLPPSIAVARRLVELWAERKL